MFRLQIELPENISNMEVDCIKKKIEDVTGYEVDVMEVTEVARIDKLKSN